MNFLDEVGMESTSIYKACNFRSHFYFLAGMASVAALSGGSVVGCCAILALVVVAYKI